MILSDADIKKAVEDGRVIIDPFDLDAVQPASVDLHLGPHFLVFRNTNTTCIDLAKPVDDLMEEVTIDENRQFILHPGQFALGITYETVGVSSSMVGRLEGKSSLGRVGLIIHATAGFLDPGNKLKMTLELHNIANLPIVLYYRMPVAQIAFEELSSPATRPYGHAGLNSKYYGADRPQASQFWKNSHKFLKK